MAVAMIGPKFYAWDRNGKPLAFGKLYTYEARTNIPKPTYQSEDQVVENTNPVILNGEGYANVYLDGSYKMVLKDSNDNEIWSSDPVSSNQPSSWVNCRSATYVSPTSFSVAGNATSIYQEGVRLRIDNGTPEYSYATVSSSSYGSGETVVIVDAAVITTQVDNVCTSIVDPNALPNREFESIEKMLAGEPFTLLIGDRARTGRTTWERVSGDGTQITDYRVIGYLDMEDFENVDLTDSSHDDTESALLAASVGGSIVVGKGTLTLKPVSSGEVNLISKTKFWGLGKGISNILISEDSNPASDTHGFRHQDLEDVIFEHLTIRSDSKEKGIFNLGSLNPDGTYDRTEVGRLYAMRVSGAVRPRFRYVSIEGFNSQSGAVLFTNESGVVKYNTDVELIQCDSKGNRSTGFSLQAVDGYRIEGGIHEENGLQVFDSVDADGNPTSIARTPTNYIDGGTGYGIVIGRQTSANKLKTKNGIVIGVKTRRNVRHGIDLHSGNGVEIIGHESIDDLISSEVCLDLNPSLEDVFGDFISLGSRIAHTKYSENRGYLFDSPTAGVERADSNPILVSNLSGAVINAKISDITVTNWRFRQLAANSAIDTIMFVAATANNKCELENATFTATDADFYPAKMVDLNADQAVMENVTAKYGIRGTFNRAAFRLTSNDANSHIVGNSLEEINVYDTGTNQVQRPMFEKTQVSDKPTFVGNTIKRSAQGVRGSLWDTTSSNAQWGYNGFLGANSGNTLDGLEYASRVTDARTFYVSAAGAGNMDGTTESNAFNMSNVANLEAIWNQLPICQSGLTIRYLDTKDFGGEAGLDVPAFFSDMVVFMDGDPSENTLSSSKTAGLVSTGNFFVRCPLRSDIRWRFLKIKGGGTVLDKPSEVDACAIENNNNDPAQIGVNIESVIGYVSNTDFNKGGSAILAARGATVVSRGNGSAVNAPTNGLNANGGIIMKNGAQPGGAEVTSNGGVIR